MDNPVLSDKNVFPNDTVLSKHLGIAKKSYDSLMKFISGSYPSFTVEWRYYNDGKSWLCKIVKKKKTICWLSVREKCFRITFYFTAKYDKEICKLEIDNNILKEYKGHKGFGKIKPLTFVVKAMKQIEDIKKVIEFKEKLK